MLLVYLFLHLKSDTYVLWSHCAACNYSHLGTIVYCPIVYHWNEFARYMVCVLKCLVNAWDWYKEGDDIYDIVSVTMMDVWSFHFDSIPEGSTSIECCVVLYCVIHGMYGVYFMVNFINLCVVCDIFHKRDFIMVGAILCQSRCAIYCLSLNRNVYVYCVLCLLWVM